MYDTIDFEKVRRRRKLLRGKDNKVNFILCLKRLILLTRIHHKRLLIICIVILSLFFMISIPVSNSELLMVSWTSRPIVVGINFVDDHISNLRRLPLHDPYRYPSWRQVDWSMEEEERQNKLRDEKYYTRKRRENHRDKQCKLADWQKHIKPTCNTVHENDLTDLFIENEIKADERVRLIAHGYWRDVWKIRDGGKDTWTAFKSIRYVHDYTDRNYERHERDAIVMETLTASKNIVNMYSFCGHSTFTDFTDEGSVSDLIWPKDGSKMTLSMRERLDMAINIAKAVVDVHFFKRADVATISHADISPSQFLIVDGQIKLNDFNRCRFIYRKRNDEACSFEVGSNPGKFRSPEEYKYLGENEKIDVYSMGNVFYSLITELWPFSDISVEEAQEKIINGLRPSLKPKENITDESEMILSKAIEMCWIQEPRQRSSSKQVLSFLQQSV